MPMRKLKGAALKLGYRGEHFKIATQVVFFRGCPSSLWRIQVSQYYTNTELPRG